LSIASIGLVDKMVFGNVLKHGRPAGHTLAQLSLSFVPHHFLM
jgi:hypothetical protein